MQLIIAYLLGFLTAYLETHGSNRTGWLTALSATGLVVLRLVGGEIMRPYTKKLWRRVRHQIKPNTYLTHHAERHPTFKHKDCEICLTREETPILASR